jgi:hypothetical protein
LRWEWDGGGRVGDACTALLGVAASGIFLLYRFGDSLHPCTLIFSWIVRRHRRSNSLCGFEWAPVVLVRVSEWLELPVELSLVRRVMGY